MEKALDFILQNKWNFLQIFASLLMIHIIIMSKLGSIRLFLLTIYLFQLSDEGYEILSKLGIDKSTIHLIKGVVLLLILIFIIPAVFKGIRNIGGEEPTVEDKGFRKAFKSEKHFKIAIVEIAIFLTINALIVIFD